jgi:hypothetical protein
MATTKLSNFEIKKRTDKNLQEYFMIINNDNNDDVYFCFKTKVQEGWEILTKIPSPVSIEIEYEENEQNGRIYKRALALFTDDNIFV